MGRKESQKFVFTLKRKGCSTCKHIQNRKLNQLKYSAAAIKAISNSAGPYQGTGLGKGELHRNRVKSSSAGLESSI